ncbi:hypothetical protein EW145_g6281 [Phellinidium pouzarii]|uniref:Uncharacterized protein n=1 Tax=Phellinidium pouzarii TaxID=167371 RepID=A0A4S4KX28_9AGAM|nr:hypothetical protein EW145_g6281 [Phellinidium pouzarii]
MSSLLTTVVVLGSIVEFLWSQHSAQSVPEENGSSAPIEPVEPSVPVGRDASRDPLPLNTSRHGLQISTEDDRNPDTVKRPATKNQRRAERKAQRKAKKAAAKADREKARRTKFQTTIDDRCYKEVAVSGNTKSIPQSTHNKKRKVETALPAASTSSHCSSSKSGVKVGPSQRKANIEVIAATESATFIDRPVEPKSQICDPREAYKWFRVVRKAVLVYRRADLTLDHECEPDDIVFLCSLGWITLDQCLDWADARDMLGRGLLSLTSERVMLNLKEGIVQPSEEEVAKEWEFNAKDIRWMKPLSEWRDFDRNQDWEERARHGPFGPSWIHFASPTLLESILRIVSRKLRQSRNKTRPPKKVQGELKSEDKVERRAELSEQRLANGKAQGVEEEVLSVDNSQSVSENPAQITEASPEPTPNMHNEIWLQSSEHPVVEPSETLTVEPSNSTTVKLFDNTTAKLSESPTVEPSPVGSEYAPKILSTENQPIEDRYIQQKPTTETSSTDVEMNDDTFNVHFESSGNLNPGFKIVQQVVMMPPAPESNQRNSFVPWERNLFAAVPSYIVPTLSVDEISMDRDDDGVSTAGYPHNGASSVSYHDNDANGMSCDDSCASGYGNDTCSASYYDNGDSSMNGFDDGESMEISSSPILLPQRIATPPNQWTSQQIYSPERMIYSPEKPHTQQATLAPPAEKVIRAAFTPHQPQPKNTPKQLDLPSCAPVFTPQAPVFTRQLEASTPVRPTTRDSRRQPNDPYTQAVLSSPGAFFGPKQHAVDIPPPIPILFQRIEGLATDKSEGGHNMEKPSLPNCDGLLSSDDWSSTDVKTEPSSPVRLANKASTAELIEGTHRGEGENTTWDKGSAARDKRKGKSTAWGKGENSGWEEEGTMAKEKNKGSAWDNGDETRRGVRGDETERQSVLWALSSKDNEGTIRVGGSKGDGVGRGEDEHDHNTRSWEDAAPTSPIAPINDTTFIMGSDEESTDDEDTEEEDENVPPPIIDSVKQAQELLEWLGF